MNVIAMTEVRAASERGARFWFSPGAMRFFRSRVGSTAYATDDGRVAYFVSSEQFDRQSPRLYTVRKIDMGTGIIDDVSTFQEYASWAGADGRARREAEHFRG